MEPTAAATAAAAAPVESAPAVEVTNALIPPEFAKTLKESSKINLYTFKSKVPTICVSSQLTEKTKRKSARIFMGDMMDKVIVESAFMESSGICKFEPKDGKDDRKEPSFVLFLPIQTNKDLEAMVKSMEERLHKQCFANYGSWFPRKSPQERDLDCSKLLDRKGIAKPSSSPHFEPLGRQVGLKCSKFTTFYRTSMPGKQLALGTEDGFPLKRRGVYSAEWTLDHMDLQETLSPILYLNRVIFHDNIQQQKGLGLFDNLLLGKLPEPAPPASAPDANPAPTPTPTPTSGSGDSTPSEESPAPKE